MPLLKQGRVIALGTSRFFCEISCIEARNAFEEQLFYSFVNLTTLRKSPSNVTKQALDLNPQGKRKVGRPNQTWRRSTDAEVKAIGTTWAQLRRTSEKRVPWRSVVAALCSLGNQKALSKQVSIEIITPTPHLFGLERKICNQIRIREIKYRPVDIFLMQELTILDILIGLIHLQSESLPGCF